MFKNREEAGIKLADKIRELVSVDDLKNSSALAIPKGGIVIGGTACDKLNIPLDFLIIKKVSAPEKEELIIGAIGEGGVVVWEEELCQRLDIPLEYKQEIIKKKVDELEKKTIELRGGKPAPEIKGKSVFIFDDGVATGATMKVAIRVVRNFEPKEIIVSVPVIDAVTLEEIKKISDKVIYLEAPEMFFSVEQFYENFEQISDEKAKEILGYSV